MEATLQRSIAEAEQRAAQFPPNVRSFVAQMLVEEACMLYNKTSAAVVRGWLYKSYHDLVLRHGEVRMAPIHSDDILGVMEERHCYSNAYDAAVQYQGYTYVEGFAQTQFMTVQHAWLEDADGTIIDPTWANLDLPIGFRATYAGIKFTTEFVLAHVAHTGWHSILAGDWRAQHEILQRGLKIDDNGYAYSMGDIA